MLREIELVLLAEAQLKEVIIERLLADSYFFSSIVERVAYHVSFFQYTVVEFAPQRYLLDDVFNQTLLHSFRCYRCFFAILCIQKTRLNNF